MLVHRWLPVDSEGAVFPNIQLTRYLLLPLLIYGFQTPPGTLAKTP